MRASRGMGAIDCAKLPKGKARGGVIKGAIGRAGISGTIPAPSRRMNKMAGKIGAPPSLGQLNVGMQKIR